MADALTVPGFEMHAFAEYFEELEGSTIFDDRVLALEKVIKSFGFGQFVYLWMKDPSVPAPHHVSNFISVDFRDPEWREQYDECGLAAVDPVRLATRDQYTPILYEEVPIWNDAQNRFRDRARVDGRQVHGLSFAIPAINGAQCGFGAVERDDEPSQGVALGVLSAVKAFHALAEAEFTSQRMTQVGISPSERRILIAMTLGMRSRRIASEYGIDAAYVDNVKSKLRARFACETDPQLVVKLQKLGVLRV